LRFEISEEIGMKNTGKCPKCGSGEIYVAKMDEANSMWVGFLSNVPIKWLVCGECGLVEPWIAEREDLEKVRAKCSRHRVG
jgi:uncharacterized Zn finger protein